MLPSTLALAMLACASRPCVVPTATATPAKVAAAPIRAPLKQDVNLVIARAQAAWARVRTLRASFEQTITNPITGSSLSSKGTLQQRKPNRLAISFSEPAGDRIVADGKFVWVYLQSATPGQVLKLASTDVGAATNDLIGQFLNTPRGKFNAVDGGSEKIGARTTRVLVLTAKTGERLPFVRAKVWVDTTDNLIRQFESVDHNGVSRRVRLLTFTPNVTVDDKAFTFRVPANVRVVER